MTLRILFSATPAHGHVLPLLPLARALRARGHEVAMSTGDALGPVLTPEGFTLLPAGPPMGTLLAEAARRTGADPTQPTPETVAELFAGVRLDLSVEQALAAAWNWMPDLVVSELVDYVGPLVAAVLDVPVATLAYGPALPPEFVEALRGVAASRYRERALAARPAAWYLDTCPPALQPKGWRPPPTRVPLRPEAHRQPQAIPQSTDTDAALPGAERRRRPRVLVTFGTQFSAPKVLTPLLRELSTADLDLVVTLGLTALAEDFDVDRDRVTFAEFTPLDQLLHGIDLVVTHGGAGTTIGALAAGIALVLLPQGADQFLQADRVTAAGAGLALLPGQATPVAVAATVAAVLAEPGFKAAAGVVAAQIAALPSADDVAAQLEAAFAGGICAADHSTVPLDPEIRALIDAPEFVTMATLAADGRPRQSVVWAKTHGDDVLVSTTADRLKYHDLRRDPRVSLLAFPKEQPYVYTAIEGTASITTDGGPELIQELSQRYSGSPYTFDGPDVVRVVIRITPTKAVLSNPESRRVASAESAGQPHPPSQISTPSHNRGDH